MLFVRLAVYCVVFIVTASNCALAGTSYQRLPANGMNWEQARTAALSLSTNTNQCYLANITSQAELDYIEANVPNVPNSDTMAIGGRRSGNTSNTWYWADGPESGVVFWKDGAAVGENFPGWDPENRTETWANAIYAAIHSNYRPYVSGNYGDSPYYLVECTGDGVQSNYTLTYTKAGSGNGSVSFSPQGTLSNCDTSCVSTYAAGTVVTLTATPSSGSEFVGWTGSCDGTGSCDVTISTAKSVTATFEIKSTGNASGSQYNFTLDNPSSYATDSWPHFVESADFNGDGALDIVVPNEFSQNINIFLNKGDGTFNEKISYPIGSGINCTGVAVGDFNNDGILDLVVTGYTSNPIVVLLGKGLDSQGYPEFEPEQHYDAGDSTQSATVSDLNGDGFLDIIVPSENTWPFTVFLNDKTGHFSTKHYSDTPAGTIFVGVADVNNDGYPDAIANHFWGSHTNSIYLNDGTGNFTYMKEVVGGYTTSVGDVNGDGVTDIVEVNINTDTLSVLVNDGSASFTTSTYKVGSRPGWHLLVDLNNDKFNDLIICNQGTPTYDVLINDGKGDFPSRITYQLPSLTWRATAADLNGDRLPDIITAPASSNQLWIFLQTVSIATASDDSSIALPGETVLVLEGDDVITPSSNGAVSVAGVANNSLQHKAPSVNPASSISRTIDGGPGLDKLVLPTSRSDFKVTKNDNGSLTIFDRLGKTGSTVFRNGEYLQFSDQTVKIATLPNVKTGTDGDNTLTGTSRNEYFYGLRGKDVISARGGNDHLEGGADDDTENGEDGDDVFLYSLGRDSLDGGKGIDTADYSAATSAISVKLNGSIQVSLRLGGRVKDRLTNIENIVSSSFSDTINGDQLNNILNGNAGNDSVTGADGNDVILGGLGNDALEGGLGRDLLVGGLGRDSLIGGDDEDVFKFFSVAEIGAGSGGDTVIDFVSGKDVVDLSAIDANIAIANRQSFVFLGRKAFSKSAGQLRFSGGALFGDTNGDGIADFKLTLSGVSMVKLSDMRL